MKSLYYGVWHSIMGIGWPVRFLMELAAVVLLCRGLFWLLKCLGRKLQLKKVFVNVTVFLGTELFYLVGHNKEWAKDKEDRLFAWKEMQEGGASGRRKSRKRLWVAALCLVYIAGTAADFPFLQALNEPYKNALQDAKAFFQQGEVFLAKDYEAYPPLFSVEKEEETDSGPAVEAQEPQEVYLLLNSKGQGGSNIRKEASLKAKAVAVADTNDSILYLNEIVHDGERYWMKVCLVEKDVTGWLSANLVEEEQVQSILDSLPL